MSEESNQSEPDERPGFEGRDIPNPLETTKPEEENELSSKKNLYHLIPPEPKEAGDWEKEWDASFPPENHKYCKRFIRSLLAEREQQAFKRGHDYVLKEKGGQILNDVRYDARRQLISSIREKIEKLRKEEKPVKIFTDPNKLIHMLDLHEAKGYNSALAEFLTFLEEK